MTRSAAFLALSAACLSLSACGLQPMYAGGGSGEVARGLAAIDVPPIEGKAGWLVRNALNDRLGAAGVSNFRYRLDVRLDDSLEGLAVLVAWQVADQPVEHQGGGIVAPREIDQRPAEDDLPAGLELALLRGFPVLQRLQSCPGLGIALLGAFELGLRHENCLRMKNRLG